MSNLIKSKLFRVLVISQALYIIYSLWCLSTIGRLPSPFFYNAADSYMDFYSTNYWAYNSARFEEWKSIYPIFVFVFSKLFTSDNCIAASDPFALRDCDSGAIYYMAVVAIAACIASAYSVLDSLKIKYGNKLHYAIMLFVLFFTSTALLYAFERGNYILLALFFLAMSMATSSSWLSALFLAAAINIKQYLLLLLLVPFLKRQWSYLSLTVLACVCINLLALILISEPKYQLLVPNMLGFSENNNGVYFEKTWNPTSILAWHKSLIFSWHAEQSISPNYLEIFRSISFTILLVVRSVSGVIFFYLLLQSEKLSPEYISTVLLVLMLVNTDALGGYALILLYPFLGAFSNRPLAKWLYLFIFGMLLPLEIPIGLGILNEAQSWLSGLKVHETMFVTLGAMTRPWTLIVILGTMGIDIWIGSKMNQNFSLEV